jgi:hypothetical protein
MKVYITYDASKARNELKTELLKSGFQDSRQADNKTYYLPNTSLWHPDLSDLAAAKRKFDNVVNAINAKRPYSDQVKVDRFIVVAADPWDGVTGEPHSN